MYKLLIKDRQGNWQTADMGDDVPAMNFQINDIATLKDLNNNYSQTLKLPRTPNNCTLFEYADNFDILTDVPYSKHDCRLFSNDSIICGPGSILYLDKINDFFEVQIASGSAGLFETLQDKPMSDLDLGFYILGSHSMIDNYIEPVYWRFSVPIATFIKKGTSILNTSAAHSYPFAYLKPAIEAILKHNGYNLPNGTLETNLIYEDWSTKAINICSLDPSTDSFTALDATAIGYSIIAPSQTIRWSSSNTTLKEIIGVDGAYLEWIAPEKCTARIKFICNVPTTSTAPSIIIRKNDTNLFDDSATPRVINYDKNISFEKGDKIYVDAVFFYHIDIAGISFTFSITEIAADTVFVGGKLHLSNNLGFESQFDFFKAFVQSFGLTVRVDEATKTVSAYTMQELYNNKSKKLDWSKKVNDIEKNTVFSIGSYGQTNTIKFNDNSDDVVTDSGSFNVNNASLPLTKELFSIAFEAVKSAFFSGVENANIPIEEKSTEGIVSFKGGKPHLVNIVAVGSRWAQQVKVQSLIDTYYPKLVQMLTNAKMLTDVELWLTDQDIEDLDQFVPVWIEKYGCYFYVNKVKNYISGKLTKCDLIKL